MPSYKFSQRVSDATPLLDWIASNIPNDHIVRKVVHPNKNKDIREPNTDIYLVIDDLGSAHKIAAYMNSEAFTSYILRDMRYFMLSWYPHRPDLPELA